MIAASSWAAELVTRHPLLLDELLDERLLEATPDWPGFERALRALLAAAAGDTERQMNILREEHRARVFRLLAQDLGGALTVERLADHLSELADRVLGVTLELAWLPLVIPFAFVAGCDSIFRAIRVADGTQAYQIDSGAYTGASPVLAGDRAYFGTFNYEVLALDLKRRTIAWRYADPDAQFPYYSSAALDGTRVIVGGRDKVVHAIDSATGKRAWAFATRARVDSSPVVAGGRVYIGSNDGRLYALDAASGRKVWEFEIGAAITASPSIAAGRLVIGAEDGVGTIAAGVAKAHADVVLISGDSGGTKEDVMSAYNVVRLRVKPGHEKEFEDRYRELINSGNYKYKGLRKAVVIRTGDSTYCTVGEWDSFDDIVAARPEMSRNLGWWRERDVLEDLGGGLGVTQFLPDITRQVLFGRNDLAIVCLEDQVAEFRQNLLEGTPT